MGNMAYIATDPKTHYTYAISSADPRHADSLAEDLKEWVKDGATIELLPKDEALARFCEPQPLRQASLF